MEHIICWRQWVKAIVPSVRKVLNVEVAGLNQYNVTQAYTDLRAKACWNYQLSASLLVWDLRTYKVMQMKYCMQPWLQMSGTLFPVESFLIQLFYHVLRVGGKRENVTRGQRLPRLYPNMWATSELFFFSWLKFVLLKVNIMYLYMN